MPRAAKGTARGPLHPARPCLTRLRSGFPTAWPTRCPRQPNTGRLADALGLSRVWRTMRRLALALRPEFSADLWSVLGRWIRDTPWFRLVPDDLISPAQHTFRHHDEEALQALLKPVAAAPPTALTAVSRRLRRTGSAPTDRPFDRPDATISNTTRSAADQACSTSTNGGSLRSFVFCAASAARAASSTRSARGQRRRGSCSCLAGYRRLAAVVVYSSKMVGNRQ